MGAFCRPGKRACQEILEESTYRRARWVWQPWNRRENPSSPFGAASIRFPTLDYAWMQMMVIEFGPGCARNRGRQFIRIRPSTANPVIDLMPTTRLSRNKGGTMRLGLYPCNLQPGTIAPRRLMQKVPSRNGTGPSFRVQQQTANFS